MSRRLQTMAWAAALAMTGGLEAQLGPPAPPEKKGKKAAFVRVQRPPKRQAHGKSESLRRLLAK